MSAEWIDLGDGHALRYVQWAPDRDLNPQHADLPDVQRYGADVRHTNPAGQPCMGYITFDSDTARRIATGAPMWQVESFDPPSFSPSLLCSCGDHGFIREGRWVRA
jgi:hypothetical protein